MKKIILINTILLLSFQTVFGQEMKQSKLLSLGVLNNKAKTLPMPPNIQPRSVGSVSVQVKINLQKGEVIEAQAVSGIPLLWKSTEKAALEAKFEPILQEFETVYGTGILVYKVEDFTGKTVKNKKPKPIITIIKGGILNGKTRVLPKPVYSEEMRNSCAYGKVEVEVLNYAPTGKILLSKAVSGDEILRKSAEDAAMKTTFSVPLINGDINFYVKGKLVYNFEPSEKCISGQLSDTRKYRLIADLKPKVISMPKPEFPGGMNVSGTVSVIVTIDEQGNVIDAEAISGHPLLRQPSEKAAIKAKFEPYSLGGKPMKIRFPIAYVFEREEIPQLKIFSVGKTVDLRKPIFPTNCRCRFSKYHKTVVEFTVNNNGFVESAKGILGHPLLRIVSEQATRNSKFTPSSFDNVNVKTNGKIIYEFFIRKKKWQTRIAHHELKNL